MQFKQTLKKKKKIPTSKQLGGNKQYAIEIIVRKKRDSCVRTVGEVENKATMGM